MTVILILTFVTDPPPSLHPLLAERTLCGEASRSIFACVCRQKNEDADIGGCLQLPKPRGLLPLIAAAGGLGVREDADGERQQPRRDPEASQEMAEAPGFHGRASPEQGMAG
ncbi:hypothetical protein AMECASPLE_032868 [Ameca splendens]|uniref:Uncharacterized protein n=1 Tax=Ameca splendens TaxID=208324 RepID=A0ABV1A238_9TELE